MEQQLVLACAQQGRVGLRQLINAHFSDKRFPVHAVDFLSQHEVRQSIFAPDYWGGYLIYRLYPQRHQLEHGEALGSQFNRCRRYFAE